MIYGYCRVSTAAQSIARQIRNVKEAYPNAKIYQEAYSGREMSRPQFDKLLKVVRGGDVVVFDSVSRMARDAKAGVELYKRLFSEGVELVFLKEPHIDTRVYREELNKQIDAAQVASSEDADVNKLIAGIIDAMNTFLMALASRQIEIAFQQAAKEVEDLRQRTREGIATARAEGKQIGQTEGAKLHVKKADEAKAIISKHSKDFGGTLNDADVMALAHVSKNSYYKYKSELRAEANA